MRNGKKPTRKQKIRLGQAGLAPENWLVIKQKQNGELVILHKHTNKTKVLPALAAISSSVLLSKRPVSSDSFFSSRWAVSAWISPD